MNSYMIIDNKRFDLEDVSLRFYFQPEPRIDVFCDSKDLTKPGFAINCISLIESIREIDDLVGKAIILEMDENNEINIADNENNELSESVICRPGQELELTGLFIKFDQIEGEYITLKMKASCFSLNSLEMAIPVDACIEAIIDDESEE